MPEQKPQSIPLSLKSCASWAPRVALSVNINVGRFDDKLYVGIGNPGNVDFFEMESFE